MKLTLGEAAKHAKRAKGTISNALKNGQLSGEKIMKKGREAWQIDVSELQRWIELNTPKNQHTDPENTPKKIDQKPIENSILQVRLEASEQRFEDAQKTIEDLRARLDKAEDKNNELTNRLLPSPDKKGFFKRLFG